MSVYCGVVLLGSKNLPFSPAPIYGVLTRSFKFPSLILYLHIPQGVMLEGKIIKTSKFLSGSPTYRLPSNFTTWIKV